LANSTNNKHTAKPVKQTTMALQKILLVDDDKAFIHLNRAMFKYNSICCEIDECSNGLEALGYVVHAEKLPDAILLDINMPIMDGFGFLDRFEQQHLAGKQIAVFVLSSSREELLLVKDLQYHCVKGYFEKPLTDANIYQIVATVNNPRDAEILERRA
jgi:CheY-like chemotaxis protein